MANQLFFACLMLATGIGIPVMAALSANLGARYASPAFAASVLFLLALAISVVFLFAVEGGLKPPPKTAVPLYYYCGGVFVAFYVLSVTWVAPQFGVGNAVAFVLLGQLVSMAAIDQFGLLGAPTHAITAQRAIGLLLMSAGVFLAVRRG
ncbi:transporter family-2 protein [Andreprevotia lacus DSM 23236]|jgi:transporter family-2 protein|uniref:Transporter family-2 protein n=1 Tax=Andreprevotia lacus DSM 23236 TaxID=1121001 RepID=A0A1W1XLA4_9NEIS|nr:DMT family transporter [Andreprevotia lacus]SMC24298.1 transporter family-2 protein [Andreprevotia lacus DSM 23236]